MRARTSLLLCVASLGAAACGVLDEAATSEAAIEETDDLFGDDRVADALKGHLDAVPSSYAEAEKLFGVGRACARQDSKEIFVVEEAQTRTGGAASATKNILPRAVVTGCNTPEHNNPAANDPQWGSYSLFIALFSDPDRPSARSGDAIVTERVEAMALDRRTGLYNFYVFEPGGDPKGPGVMQRIRLLPNDSIMVYELAPGEKSPRKTPSKDRLCNACHVNMGPLMNELHEPWTNWVSTHKTLPVEAKLTGESRSIVTEAVSLDGKHARVGFANDLEKIMLASMRVWVEGTPSVPSSGFVQAVLDGDQPRGARGLLKSVLCETELQYESAFDVEPLELFVDPGAVQGAQLQKPPSSKDERFPLLMPVRSEMDKRIEVGLIKKKVLSLPTALAVRLFDEDNDVFSKKRCALYPKVIEGLPSDPAAVDKHVRAVLKKEASSIAAGPRRTYVDALLGDGVSSDALGAARTAYFEDARARVASAVTRLDTPEGRLELKKRSQARKDAAHAMFPGRSVPLPILPREALP